jgi:hypothetical protein
MSALLHLHVVGTAQSRARPANADDRAGGGCIRAKLNDRRSDLIPINAASGAISLLMKLEMASVLEARRLWDISRIVLAKARLHHLIKVQAVFGPASGQRLHSEVYK